MYNSNLIHWKSNGNLLLFFFVYIYHPILTYTLYIDKNTLTLLHEHKYLLNVRMKFNMLITWKFSVGFEYCIKQIQSVGLAKATLPHAVSVITTCVLFLIVSGSWCVVLIENFQNAKIFFDKKEEWMCTK